MPASPQGADLDRAKRLLGPRPAEALAIANKALRAAPDHIEARFIRGAALRRTGAADEAYEALAALAAQLPKAWGVQYELGAAAAMLGRTEAAIDALARACALNSSSSLAWHALADQRTLIGDRAGAETAHGRRLPGSAHDAALRPLAQRVVGGADDEAEQLVSERFGLHLSDPLAAVLVADAAERAGLRGEATRFLERYADMAPRFAALRLRRAIGFFRSGRIADALLEAEAVRMVEPSSPPLRALEAAIATQTGDDQRAIQLHGALVEQDAADPGRWLAYGHALKTAGRQAEAVRAYRESLRLDPRLGEAYWSLANLKVVRFEGGDIEAMQAVLDDGGLPADRHAPVHYALGKALEDEDRYEAAFSHYRRGAALVRAAHPYDQAANRAFVRRCIETFTPAFFEARAGVGEPAADPIFVVGLPRSGSTLVEQILASHSEVEGLSELPDVTALAADLASRMERDGRGYPEGLGAVDAGAFASLGAAYLERARLYRRRGRRFFVDKFPGNVMHLGLIRLMLPNARVVDVRRHPMACCFSVFKQYFAEGQAYSYDLSDLGGYYNDYVALVEHFRTAIPGWVTTVSYEDLVNDPETTIRTLLQDCGLPFDASCLEFHRNARSVRTASSEQVRRPISREAMDHWRRFQPWLRPLEEALAKPFFAAV